MAIDLKGEEVKVILKNNVYRRIVSERQILRIQA